MTKTIQTWLEYFGIDSDVLWLMLACIAITQLFKLLLKAFNALSPDRIRPIPYLAGSFLGLVFISFSSKGALVGMTVGFISSIVVYGAMAYLERKDSPSWQKEIANRLSLK